MASEWQRFFIQAGIPHSVASSYANAFKQNRIDKTMLKDLDKSTLAELGVTAIGDQLAILRRAKNLGDSSLDTFSGQAPRAKVVAPNNEFPTASSLRKGRPPPDRNEIYHIKMPEGNTMRTKQILAKHEALRRQGLAVRGTTGVRQSGRDVSPVDKTSVAARISKREGHNIMDRLGIRGLHSDNSHRVVATGRIDKKTITSAGARAKIIGNDMRVSVSNGSHSVITVPRNQVAGRFRNNGPSVTVSIDKSARVRRGGINNRLQLGGTPSNKRNVKNRIVYDDGVELAYGDNVVLDDDMYEDEYGDEYVEYIEKPSIYDRLSK